MIKVAVCTPTAGIVHASYTMSLVRMVLHYLQTPILGLENEERGIITQMQVGANISSNRDNMVEQAIKQECSHVLFIDDDMGFEPNCLNIMLARQLPVLLANYRRKIPPGLFTAVTKDRKECLTTVDSTSLEECWYGGFGFCLIEISVLKSVQKPRFLMEYYPDSDTYTTEDYPFFNKVHAAGFPVFVDQEVSKRVTHNGTFIYSFDQTLDPKWAVPYQERK